MSRLTAITAVVVVFLLVSMIRLEINDRELVR